MNEERKLASIQVINKLEPINNSDNLEVATILGWNVVVKKDEFKVGELCVYFEIDSILPIAEPFEFLRKSSYKKLEDGTEGFRIKTIKLRGQVSQGIVFPLSVLSSITDKELPVLEEGVDLTKELNIKQYELPIPAIISGTIAGAFPSHLVPKTDEERIQTIPQFLETYKNETFCATEKVDGTSFTITKFGEKFNICSRNYIIKEDNDDNVFIRIAKKYDLKNKLSKLSFNLAIQGEILGPKIQDNKYKLNEHVLKVFSMSNLDTFTYLTLDETLELCKQLELDYVPILISPFILNHTIEELVTLSEGHSLLNPNIHREGIVFRQVNNVKQKVSFKVINPKFLLKYAE